MAKRTAIIDIGSNSARLVIFEKTSRYGFHLICEQKSKVRLGEGAYQKGGFLQPDAIKRAFFTLQSFVSTIEKFQTTKTIAVATSALRDAPNAKIFIEWIKKELNISIKVIDGIKEANYGAIAVNNLLPIRDGITIDIGGGSSDMTLIKKGNIIDSYSLNLGTVRLKELFFDDSNDFNQSIDRAKLYIQKELDLLPDSFIDDIAIGIGGTARAISKSIMKKSNYPLDKIHAFNYKIKDYREYIEEITLSSMDRLHKLPIPKNRYDTIREGALILSAILDKIEAKELITSAVGVREGVYLKELLRDDRYKFPPSINPSVVSLLDRFKPIINIETKRKLKIKIASKLYSSLSSLIGDNQIYLYELKLALSISNIGKTLTIYKAHQHAFYIAKQELNYGLTHNQIILISLLLQMYGKELLDIELFNKYKQLLPNKNNFIWLSFIFTISSILHQVSTSDISFEYKDNTLKIISNKSLHLVKEKIKALQKPTDIEVIIEDNSRVPKNRELGV